MYLFRHIKSPLFEIDFYQTYIVRSPDMQSVTDVSEKFLKKEMRQ